LEECPLVKRKMLPLVSGLRRESSRTGSSSSRTVYQSRYYTVLYSTLLYSTLLYSTLLYSTLLYSTLLYSTPLYLPALPFLTVSLQ
jgi:hypothetical protein